MFLSLTLELWRWLSCLSCGNWKRLFLLDLLYLTGSGWMPQSLWQFTVENLMINGSLDFRFPVQLGCKQLTLLHAFIYLVPQICGSILTFMIRLMKPAVYVCTTTSTLVSWWGDSLKQRLVFWFITNQRFLWSVKWVCLLGLDFLGPASSTETHKRASTQEDAEGNDDCGADDLKESVHAVLQVSSNSL